MLISRELNMEEKEHSRHEHLTGHREMADSYPRSFVRRGKSLEMRFLAKSSLSDLAALQSLVVSALPEIEIFMPHDEEYLQPDIPDGPLRSGGPGRGKACRL